MFAFVLSLCLCLSIWNHPPSQAKSSSVNWNALLRELVGILLGHCVYLQIQLSELSQNHGYADKHGPVLYSLQTPVTSWAWIVCNHDRNNNNNNNSSNSWLAGFIAIHDVLMYSASVLPLSCLTFSSSSYGGLSAGGLIQALLEVLPVKKTELHEAACSLRGFNFFYIFSFISLRCWETCGRLATRVQPRRSCCLYICTSIRAMLRSFDCELKGEEAHYQKY